MWALRGRGERERERQGGCVVGGGSTWSRQRHMYVYICMYMREKGGSVCIRERERGGESER